MAKTKVFVMHSSHLDLFWIGAQADCLSKGAKIIDDALTRAQKEPGFHFLIETARFLEYYMHAYPQRQEALKAAFASGQFEMAACYTDRLENHVSGEALVRNALYGRKVIRQLLGLNCDLACHPDLPGFAEQTPQIYKKSGIHYYLSARGFKNGARFRWQGLDDSSIVMYNIPGHYAYYDVEKVISGFEQTKRNIQSDFILLGCSAGDLGPAGTFIAKENNKGVRYDIQDFLDRMNRAHPQYEFSLANARQSVGAMEEAGLGSLRGEYPSRWGHHGSAMNLHFYLLDKLVDQRLQDAEKLSTVCRLLGMPVELTMARHPLVDSSGRTGGRRYFDLEFTPSTLEEWLEFGWRLQMVTQDHNFGGAEGAQTEYDRLIYKKAAIRIADSILALSLEALRNRAMSGKDCLELFNTLNFQRNELVSCRSLPLDADADYEAVDAQGRVFPLYHGEGGREFLAGEVPSFGRKSFHIRKAASVPTGACATLCRQADGLVLENRYYRLRLDDKLGQILSLTDLETGKVWLSGGGALRVTALRDDSLGGSERSVDKPILDQSDRRVAQVELEYSNPLYAQLKIVKEITDVKLVQRIRLYNFKKQMDLRLSMNWPGTPDVQLKLDLGSRSQDSRIVYGVPYGAQEYGKYLETESLVFGGDEISYELFNRYREAQGFVCVEEEGQHLTVASNHSAYDFLPGGVQALLLRDVRNGSEHDYRFTNFGQVEYTYCYTSGLGGQAASARLPWERQFPLLVAQGAGQEARPSQESWLSTAGEGILTVLKPSETQPGAAVVRLYNPGAEAKPLALANGLGLAPAVCVNLDETPADEAPDRLGGFEIKTLLLRP